MSQCVGDQLVQSEKVNNMIGDLTAEVESFSRQIEGPRDPQESLVKENQIIVDNIGANRGRPLFYPYVGSGVGRGPYVELKDGSVKLDLINGIGIHIMGHSHPDVIKASLKGAMSDVVMQGNLQPNMEYEKLGAKLVELASRKSRLKHAWVTTSGSMSNENALKMIRQKKSPAKKLIAMKNAFAGRTTMMAEITDNPAYKVGLPEYNEILRIPFANSKTIEECRSSIASGGSLAKERDAAFEMFKEHYAKHEGDIAGFTFEPMLGEGGYLVASREYFLPILDFCKEKKIAVWMDEVQTFCRTGEFFAFEKLDIGEYVDICTVAKTAQNGATLYTEEYNPQPGLIAGTFTGSSAALSAGIEILDILDNQGYMGTDGKIESINQQFIGMLNELNETTCKGLLTEAGGLGLMVAVTPLDGSREKMIELLKVLYKNGLMTFGCGRGPFRLRFLLPAIMTTEDINVAKKIIEKSVLELA